MYTVVQIYRYGVNGIVLTSTCIRKLNSWISKFLNFSMSEYDFPVSSYLNASYIS